MKRSIPDREAEGEWDETKGWIQEGIKGGITGDSGEEAHDKFEQAGGEVKKTTGKRARRRILREAGLLCKDGGKQSLSSSVYYVNASRTLDQQLS